MQSRDNNMEINGKKIWKILDERAVQIWGKLKNVMKKWEEDYRLEGEKEKKITLVFSSKEITGNNI